MPRDLCWHWWQDVAEQNRHHSDSYANEMAISANPLQNGHWGIRIWDEATSNRRQHCPGLGWCGGKALMGTVKCPIANYRSVFTSAADQPCVGWVMLSQLSWSPSMSVYLNTFLGRELSFISFSFLLFAAPTRGLKGILGDLLCCKNNHIPCKRQANNKNTITMRTSDSADKWLTAPVMDFWVLDIHVEGEWIKGGKQKAAK